METARHGALWEQFDDDPRIQGLMHDQDAKLKKTMDRLGIRMKLMVDDSHLEKSASGCVFDKFNGLVTLPGTARQVHALSPLEQGLKQWLRHVAHSSQYETRAALIIAWMGAESHYTLETSPWKSRACDQAKAQVHEHLKAVAELILPQPQRDFRTNWNGAFNSNTARKAPKWLSLPVAYTSRVAIVVLGMN
jgi:hypothetical protein